MPGPAGAMDAERGEDFDLYQQALTSTTRCPETPQGRGIVTCGSQKFAPYLFILIKSLRHHGCTLPIELWHMDGEINEPLKQWLEPYGVTFKDGGALSWGRNRLFNGAHGIKPYSVVHSGFREVLFLDADNSVCADPTFLFETPEYQQSGALFWSDPVAARRSSARRSSGRTSASSPAARSSSPDSSSWTRRAHGPALMLTLHLNERSGYYYRYLFGDKETFRMGFDAVRQPYVLATQPKNIPDRDWLHKGHVQYWIDGTPLFFHRVGRKWEIIVTRQENHDLSHLPPALVSEIFEELQRRWPEVMPLRERARPYLGVMRRTLQPMGIRPYFRWLTSLMRVYRYRGRR